MPPLSPRSSSGTQAPRRKNTLFCPSCGHASPMDGDWRRGSTESGVVYTCPVCDAAVTTRPTSRDPQPSDRPASAGTLVGRAIGAAWAWAAWPYTLRSVRPGAFRHP